MGLLFPAIAAVPNAAAEGLKFAGGAGMENVWRCSTPAVIPGAASPMPRLGRGRQIFIFLVTYPNRILHDNPIRSACWLDDIPIKMVA